MRKALCFLLIFCADASAGEIVLKNGDRLTGKIVRMNDSRIVLETALLGKISIPRTAIDKIQQDAPASPPSNPPNKAPAEQQHIVAGQPKPKPGELFKLWGGSIDAAISATRGNADTRTINLGARAARISERNKLSLYVTSILSSTSTNNRTTIADTIRGGSRYEINFKRRLFTFGFADLEHSKFQGLALRSVGGGGLGFNVAKTPKTTFQVFSGGSANFEQYQSRTARVSREFVAGYDFSYQLSSASSLTESLTVYPNLSAFGQYRVTFDSSVVTRLNSWLAWHVTTSSRYTSNPPAGRKNNDLLITTGIRFVHRGDRVENVEARPELRRK